MNIPLEFGLFGSEPVPGPPCLKCKEPTTDATDDGKWRCRKCGHKEEIDVSGV